MARSPPTGEKRSRSCGAAGKKSGRSVCQSGLAGHAWQLRPSTGPGTPEPPDWERPHSEGHSAAGGSAPGADGVPYELFHVGLDFVC
eukprot:9210610-Alexandrium_andersonii.AAC.1